MTVSPVLDAAGRRRSPATMPGYHAGRPPRNKGRLYPADPPTVEEIVAVMRHAPDDRHGWRVRAMIVVRDEHAEPVRASALEDQLALETPPPADLEHRPAQCAAIRARSRSSTITMTRPVSFDAVDYKHRYLVIGEGARTLVVAPDG